MNPLERKSIEPIALHFSGEKYVRLLQQFFTRSPFGEQALLDTYQQLLSRQIGAGAGMLSVDDTSFVKKGKHSAGVKRQYCGRLGKTENRQSGVFLAYAGDKGYWLVDYGLYIPKEWFSAGYSGRREECHIPEWKTFSTKNEIAQRMPNQALEGDRFQAQWVGCDVAYGMNRAFLDRLVLPEGVWYFAATNAKEQVFLECLQRSFPETKRGTPGSTQCFCMPQHPCVTLQEPHPCHGKLWCWQKGQKAQLQQSGNSCAVFPAVQAGAGIMWGQGVKYGFTSGNMQMVKSNISSAMPRQAWGQGSWRGRQH